MRRLQAYLYVVCAVGPASCVAIISPSLPRTRSLNPFAPSHSLHTHIQHTLSLSLSRLRGKRCQTRVPNTRETVSKHAGNQRRASNWLRLIAIDSRHLIATRGTCVLPVTRRINEGRREGGRSFRKERWRWSVRARRCADVGGRMEKDKNRTIKARICARESPNLNLDLNHEQRASLPRYAYGA